MKIEGCIWYRDIIDKLLWKHNVSQSEVVEIIKNKTKFTFVEKVKVKGENLYSARGHTNECRYLIILFIYKTTKEALNVTARDIDSK